MLLLLVMSIYTCRDKDKTAVGSGLPEGRYSSVKLTMDKGYPLHETCKRVIHLLYLFNGKNILYV